MPDWACHDDRFTLVGLDARTMVRIDDISAIQTDPWDAENTRVVLRSGQQVTLRNKLGTVIKLLREALNGDH